MEEGSQPSSMRSWTNTEGSSPDADLQPEAVGPIDPNWWRCIRFSPVSGTYYGGTVPGLVMGGRKLELRVDIDLISRETPVMNRISGDFYQENIQRLPGGKPRIWRTYEESWIVEDPLINFTRCSVAVTGDVKFWKGRHLPTKIELKIPWNLSAIGPAEIAFTEKSGTKTTYSCLKTSNCFREVVLEADICKSINSEPILPSYDTYSHSIRPMAMAKRDLTIEKAYMDAGVCLTLRGSERTIIDDSDPKFMSWSDAELHDAMELYFSRYPGSWPKWQLWGLMASTYYDTSAQSDDPGCLGIMFDYGAQYGGLGRSPERQGFAIFKKGFDFDWWSASGKPANDYEAYQLRYLLHTWVHEAGHAFNLVHSWDKKRPDSLSWMNYPWRYDNRNGDNSYWKNFMMRFDDEELIHIRHGDLSSVIMGGDPWASGHHSEAPPGAMSEVEGEAPLELLLRSREYFDLMEPVIIEVRLRNMTDASFPVDINLKPESGSVALYIGRSDGIFQAYSPITCKLSRPKIKVLAPEERGVEGEDRYSDTLFLSYGARGFYFDKPGEYLIRAAYHGLGDLMILSNILRVKVGYPSKEENKLVKDFFTYPVGMSLQLHGSQSPFLKEGMMLLERVVEEQPDTMIGARLGSRIAPSISRPFFRIQDNALTMTHSAEPEKALKLTEPTVELYRRLKGPEARALNISYSKLVRRRAESLAQIGKKAKAKKEISALRQDLADRGVRETVLKEIEAFGNSL